MYKDTIQSIISKITLLQDKTTDTYLSAKNKAVHIYQVYRVALEEWLVWYKSRCRLFNKAYLDFLAAPVSALITFTLLFTSMVMPARLQMMSFQIVLLILGIFFTMYAIITICSFSKKNRIWFDKKFYYNDYGVSTRLKNYKEKTDDRFKQIEEKLDKILRHLNIQ